MDVIFYSTFLTDKMSNKSWFQSNCHVYLSVLYAYAFGFQQLIKSYSYLLLNNINNDKAKKHYSHSLNIFFFSINLQINETNLHNYLEQHERILLFGNNIADAANNDDSDGTTGKWLQFFLFNTILYFHIFQFVIAAERNIM